MHDLQLSPSYSSRHKCASWVLPALAVVAVAVGVIIAYKIYKK